jgi:hypothetical protein
VQWLTAGTGSVNYYSSGPHLFTGGNVGISNTTPDAKLDVTGNIIASTSGNVDFILRSSTATVDDGKFVIRSAGASDRLEFMNGTTPTSLMTIASTGFVGIGTTAPATMLHIGSTGVVDATALLRLQDANSTCDFTANAGAPTCGSDLRLKKDIAPISDSILDKLTSLNVVTYRWQTDTASASLQTGFIAQNVQEFFPSLIATASWIDGKPALFLSQNGLIPYLVKGIQELASKDLRIDEILASQPVLESDGPLARLAQNIMAYIANVFGFIVEKGRIQSGEVNTDTLCIGTECIGQQELQQIRQLFRDAGQSAGPINTEPVPAQVSTPIETPVSTPTDTPTSTAETPTPTATP